MSFIPSTNPSQNYLLIGSVLATEPSDIPLIVERSRISQSDWALRPVAERQKIMESLYHVFDTAREKLAQSIAEEMGMPIRQARDEVQYGLTYFRWYLDHAEISLAPEVTRETESELHAVFYEPRGVIAAIAPWNYPFSMCIWTCMQALLAGNSVIFKTSKECILTGKLIETLIQQSDLPQWVWQEIYGSGELGGILAESDIDGITFTGSTPVGKKLAHITVDHGIGCVMELGGSAPGIVTEDADIDKILGTLYFLRYSNSGQMCDGLKRLIVHTSRKDELLEKLSKMLLSQNIGDALSESTDIGPLVSEKQKEILESQYQDAIKKGATVVAELSIPPELEGAYFAPKILDTITPDMRVWQEEVFGPILPVVIYDTLEEAITLANDTLYGLGAYVFTENRSNFAYIASRIKSGMVQMNTLNYCIPENPFGGYKHSGIGREHGKWGFHEFCNIKVTSIPKA